jgi:hypothetical protein
MTGPESNAAVAFDETGLPMVSVDFPYHEIDGDDESDPAHVDLAKQEGMIRMLQWLVTRDEDARQIGIRAILLLYIIRPEQSQRSLADRLNLTPARVGQILHQLRAEIAMDTGQK